MKRSAMHLFAHRTSSMILAALACSSSVAACATDEDATPETADVAAHVVARVETPEGASVIFVDESDPEQGGAPAIGVEILSSTTTPTTDALLAQDPTALELYLALAPAAQAAQAPRALVVDHELASAAAGRADAAPRRLAVSAATGESVGPYDCADTVGWVNDFKAWAPVLDGEYIAGASEYGYTTGYVGYAPTFYFDVCRPADVVWALQPYYTGVQRRANSGDAWVTVSTNTDALDYQFRRWRYYRTSLTCSSYQYRLVVSSSPGQNHYRRAARWADEWSCQIGL